MGTGHAEPFQVALAELRERLREGGFPPGKRIAATEVADTLHLSATPVREALSRLAGEGLLEDRRGQGFFLRPLSGVDVADLYRMSLSQLTIAQDSHRQHVSRSGVVPPDPGAAATDNPIRDVERLFSNWIAEAGSQALFGSHRTLQIQLGPIRRVEPLLIDDLAAEAAELARVAEPGQAGLRVPALRRFHTRRIALADRLATLAYKGPESSQI
jgi:DNA-binding transcriptional regulator YhcF (GntR family)